MNTSIKQITVLLATILFCASSAAETLRGLDVDRGYQRAGSDFAHYHANNARECAEDCNDSNRCQAFDFDSNSRVCWLKDSVPAIRRNNHIISGKKPGHDYNYGYTNTDKKTARAKAYCTLTNRENGVIAFDGSCKVRETLDANKKVFVITLHDGTKFHFVQRSGADWQVKMGGGAYTDYAKYIDKGSNHGVFKYDDFKLDVWAEGK